MNWDHKDEWRVRGDHFLVTITRHYGPTSGQDHLGPHRWAVYAYIYPGHPRSELFADDRSIFQPAVTGLPMHGGCSYIDYHERNGERVSVQVGADYNHDGDNYYTSLATAGEARSVFIDAEQLFAVLDAEMKAGCVTKEEP